MPIFFTNIVEKLQLFLSRRGILFLIGGFVCLYCIGVLLYSHSVPDIGLRTTFSTVLHSQPQTKPVDKTSAGLQKGDEIRKVGDIPINNWVDLITAPIQIEQKLSKNPNPTWKLPEHKSADGSVWIQVHYERNGKPGETYLKLGHPPLEEFIPSILWFFVKIMFFLLGGFILWRRPNDPAVNQFFLLCVVTLGAYMGGYHWVRITTQPFLLLIFAVCAVMLPAINLHFYLMFPRKKTMLRRHPAWVMSCVYGIPFIFLVALVALYLRMRWLNQHTTNPNPSVVLGTLHMVRTISYSYMGVAAMWYGICVGCLVHSFVYARNILEKNQVKWILFGSMVAAIPISYSLYVAFFAPDAFDAGAATWPMFSASVVLTAAFAVSITRYRLMELDVIVSSGFGYFFISFLAGLVYYGVVFVATLVFNQVIAGPKLTDALTVSGTALVLLVVLDFVRSRFRLALDKRFFRDKSQLDRTLQKLGHTIEQLVDPASIGKRVLSATSEMMGIAHGGFYLLNDEANQYQLHGQVGDRKIPQQFASSCALADALRRGNVVYDPEPVIRQLSPGERQLRQSHGKAAVPMMHEGRLLAFLILGQKPTSYQKAEFELLAALAQITALALRNAEGHHTIETLNEDLQEKVQKISEQQRRILALQSQLRKQRLKADDGKEENFADDEQIDENGESQIPGRIIGSGTLIGRLLHLVEKVAVTDAVVLIRGESGTGKELLAQAVHDTSRRAAKPFVKVHCAALSPTLLESELFGHVKGAFTGAHRDKVGRFELADGGTLFLDEIGDVSLEVQTKLLRVLQEQKFERVGSSEPVQVDVRIVAATHQNLEELIDKGRFREDLFYRINVFPIYVPALRERCEDVVELAQHFVQLAAKRCGKNTLQFEDDVLSVFKSFSWPGNIRQLENVIERAVVIAEQDKITTRELPPELLGEHKRDPINGERLTAVSSAAVTRGRGRNANRTQREREEQDQLRQALHAADDNKAEAARILGMARSTLVSRMKKYGML